MKRAAEYNDIALPCRLDQSVLSCPFTVSMRLFFSLDMGRAEAYALANPPWRSFADGLGNGLGYGLILITVAFIRELLGSGKVFGFAVVPQAFYAAGYENMGFMLLAPAAFITRRGKFRPSAGSMRKSKVFSKSVKPKA